MGNAENKSEVARLLRQIELEYQAAQRALTGPALGAAQHAFITARSEHIAQYHEQLVGQVGEQEAMALVYEVHMRVVGE